MTSEQSSVELVRWFDLFCRFTGEVMKIILCVWVLLYVLGSMIGTPLPPLDLAILALSAVILLEGSNQKSRRVYR